MALVAALIGGGVGAGVVALVDNNDSNSTGNAVIHESSAAPGAAVLSGNVTIPQLVNKVIPAVVSIDVKSNNNEDEGTGMIITSDGEVITNNHVIELYTEGGNSGSITVTEYGQTKPLPATLIGYDQTKDVALLKINNASSLSTVTFGDSAKAVVGDSVVAIGNALGLSAGTPTVTQGIVSALGRQVTAGGIGTQTETLQNMIQTDAAINSGNSGGPLIDTAGQVIGMNTAVAGTSSDGTSSQNIGFAIPAASVESLLPELQKGGQTGNGGGYLGVDITTLTPALRQQYGFTPTSGAVILTVVAGSPAAKAGLVQGDVIVNIDGTTITSSEDLQKLVQKDKPGQTITITYYVGDSKRTATATLGNQAQAQQQQSSSGSGSGSTNPFGGGGFPGFGNSGATGGTPLTTRPAARREYRNCVPGGRGGSSSARRAAASRSPRRPRGRGPCCTCPPRRRTCRRRRRPAGNSLTGGTASRRACCRGRICVHFTTTSSPSIAVNSIGNFQSSMPSMESTSRRTMVSFPSIRPQAPSM